MSNHAEQTESPVVQQGAIRVGSPIYPEGAKEASPPWPTARKERLGFLSSIRRHRSASIGLALVCALALLAILAPYIAPYDPLEQDVLNALRPPSRVHLLGTDDVGRDLLSRIIVGSRISLTVGLLVVSIAGTAGIVTGLLAAYYEGWFDNLICRFIDILLAFPHFLLALVVVAILGPSLINAMLAVALSSISGYTRVTRGVVLSEKQRDYVLAARITGCSPWRIMFRHILPNIMAPIVILATLSVGSAILATASLSFLGLGAQPPTPEWGAILSRGRTYIRKAWWLSTFPGLAIMISVLGLNLLGDGLRDILDPRLRHERH